MYCAVILVLIVVNGQSRKQVKAVDKRDDTSPMPHQTSIITRAAQGEADAKRVEQWARLLREKDNLRARQTEEVRLRASATHATPLNQSQLQELNVRLQLRPTSINKSTHASFTSVVTTQSPSSAVDGAPSSIAVKQLAGEVKRQLRKCSAAFRMLFDSCALHTNDGRVTEHQMAEMQSIFSELQLRPFIARAVSLECSMVDTDRPRKALLLLLRKLREVAALVVDVRAALLSSGLSWPRLCKEVDALMTADRGVFVNQAVLCSFQSEYRRAEPSPAPHPIPVEAMSEEASKAHMIRIRERLLTRAISSGDAGEEVATTNYDPLGPAFTDGVMQRLRDRLAAISTENGRDPGFIDDCALSDDDGAALQSGVLPVSDNWDEQLVVQPLPIAADVFDNVESPLYQGEVRIEEHTEDEANKREVDLDQGGGDASESELDIREALGAQAGQASTDSAMMNADSLKGEAIVQDSILVVSEQSAIDRIRSRMQS
jgi:hypothetical protein